MAQGDVNSEILTGIRVGPRVFESQSLLSVMGEFVQP